MWFFELPLATKLTTPCERVLETVLETGVFFCVPFCLRSLRHFERCDMNWKYVLYFLILTKVGVFLKLRISCYLCLYYMSSTRKRDHEEKTFDLIARTMIEIKVGATTGNENCVRHVAIFVQEKENFFTVDLRHICTTIVILSRGINSGRWDEKGVKQSRPEKRENSNTFTILLHGATHKQGPHWFRLTLTSLTFCLPLLLLSCS